MVATLGKRTRVYQPTGETIVSNYILADIATKAAYFSLMAAAFLFVSLLLLTTLHP
jgi:hypothetical protein